MLKKFVIIVLAFAPICLGQSIPLTPTPKVSAPPCLSSSNFPAEASAEPCLPAPPGATSDTTIDVPGAPQPLPPRTPPSTRVVGPLNARSDFEVFAESVAGRPLPVFGRKLFDRVPTTFAPVEDTPVPANYVLGPGDELLIRVWGKISFSSRVTVDRSGQIFVPRVGSVTVSGLRYEQVEGFIRSAISGFYKDFELNVTLGRLRSIQIFVLGNARQPGSFTVSSLSTLIDVLFASGGPSAIGTMRRIQLRRMDRVVTVLDLYDVLRSGDKSHDAQLLPGDVIYIPVAGPQVAVFGSVNEAGIYELADDSTVGSALKDAGSLTSLAETDRMLLERVENHRERRIEEFALDSSGLQRLLHDGDLLHVFPISPKFENAVTLRGNVAQPGRYAWHEGMRISDLIPARSFLITRKYWNQKNRFSSEIASDFDARTTNRSSDQLQDKTGDDLSERSDKDSIDRTRDQDVEQSNIPRKMEPIGARQNQVEPRQSEDSNHTSISEIGQNRAEINWEYAVIERLDERDLSTNLIPFRLASAIDNTASADNQALKAGDVVTIFSRADLELPMAKHASFIRVGGEVNAPGVYRVDPGETLRDALQRSGGFTNQAYPYAARFTRLSTRHAQEEQLKQSSEKMQRELISRYANATPTPGQTSAEQQAQLGIQQAAIANLSAIKPTGRVVLDIKPNAATVNDIPDFPIEDGDIFYVPPRLSTIQVSGSVYNANAFRHQPGKNLSAYLNDAGGPTREADRKRIFVIRADGTVISRQSRTSYYHGNFEKLKLLPGDAIVVPEKLKTPGGMRGILQVTQALSQSALTAAALGTVLP